MKNSNDSVGNETRDLPACRAVPKPTAPPRAPIWGVKLRVKITYTNMQHQVYPTVIWDNNHIFNNSKLTLHIPFSSASF
jgi:hypothetical protein